MALIAICGRLDMPHGLAVGRNSVVAGGARTDYARMVEADLGPAPCRMTVVTRHRRTNVVRRLSRRDPPIVTGAAKPRGAFKNAVQMAAFTIDQPVLRLERKSRVDVIGDLFRGRRRMRPRRQKRKKRAEQQRANPIKPNRRGGQTHITPVAQLRAAPPY